MQVDLERLFRPRTVAVFGGREAAEVIRQCDRMGYDGEVWPVHPKHSKIEGRHCFRTVADLPRSPDASFIGVNRKLTIDIVRALQAFDAGGAVCYASGFGEVEDGGLLQEKLLEAAGSMPIVGPNCYGLINYLDGALLWPDQHGGRRVDRGVAILAQSSNMAINLTMQRRGLPIAYVLALGNQAQVGLAEAIDAVLADERVTAIGLYIEGLGDVVALEEVVRRARERQVPVIAIKAGRSDAAVRIALSHTASLVGIDSITNAYLERIGIARVYTLEQLIETLKLLHVYGPIPGSRISSMSCSGGEASLVADVAEALDIQFPSLTESQQEAVAATLSELVSVSNPLDYHTFNWNDEEQLYATYRAMLECGFDLSLLVLDFPREDRCTLETWQPSVSAIHRAAKSSGQKVAVLSTLPENQPEWIAEAFMARGIASLAGVDTGLIAIETAAKLGRQWQEALPERLHGPLDIVAGENDSVLDEWKGKEKLAQIGIAVPRGLRISSVKEALNSAQKIGWPVVLKVCDSAIVHKSEQAGVVLELNTAQVLSENALRMLSAGNFLLVEEMISDAVAELLVSVEHDPQFGYFLVVGRGGVTVELDPDRVLVLLPANRSMFYAALARLRCFALLQGYRGSSPGDVEAVIDVLSKVATFALEQRNLLELELNPLLVRPVGRGAIAVDVLVRFAESG